MNNQMMMAPAPRANGASNGAMDVWSNPQTAQTHGLAFPSPHQAHAPAGPSPVQMAQRLLRGRVALAIVLAGIGAIIGGVAGFMSQAPTYKSLGMVAISPSIPVVESDTKTMPYYMQFMTSQATVMTSPGVINEVPKYEPWKSVVGKDDAALADLGANLKVAYIQKSFNIGLEYDAPNPKVASAGVYSVIQAYKDYYKKIASTGVGPRLKAIEDQQRDVQAQKDAAQAGIDTITAKYGASDLGGLVAAAETKKQDIDRNLSGYRNNLRAAKDAIEAMHAGGGAIPVEELAQVDQHLSDMQGQYNEAVVKEQLMEANYGKNSPTVRQLSMNIDIMKKSIEAYADTMRKDTLAIIPDFVNGKFFRVTPGGLRALETRVATLEDEFNAAEKDRASLAVDAGKVATFTTTIRQTTDKLQKLSETIETMKYTAAMAGDLQVMQDGQYATKASDKKILFGLAGAVFGAIVPVGMLMLLGLMDTRFRSSDDTTTSTMAGIPLLGILPNLPDRLSDPAQASIAAHCVHQIRTMLQLNSMREQSTCFAVTSASSGDGKTSLSLALGLSFAASGSRTLLVDADLVGGGLTSRLGNSHPRGIVDALGGADLDQCVQPTDVTDLSLLPLGVAQAHHAGSFSPPAVRRLMTELRKHYEVIVIDTGPIMGSIEATPIAASVDGVVLTVARGQSRPLVERAIAHLRSVGAHVAGVVFNRAQHRDFEQSIGAISIRSAARSTAAGTGHNARRPGDFGAVATAVASSVRQDT